MDYQFSPALGSQPWKDDFNDPPPSKRRRLLAPGTSRSGQSGLRPTVGWSNDPIPVSGFDHAATSSFKAPANHSVELSRWGLTYPQNAQNRLWIEKSVQDICSTSEVGQPLTVSQHGQLAMSEIARQHEDWDLLTAWRTELPMQICSTTSQVPGRQIDSFMQSPSPQLLDAGASIQNVLPQNAPQFIHQAKNHQAPQLSLQHYSNPIAQQANQGFTYPDSTATRKPIHFTQQATDSNEYHTYRFAMQQSTSLVHQNPNPVPKHQTSTPVPELLHQFPSQSYYSYTTKNDQYGDWPLQQTQSLTQYALLPGDLMASDEPILEVEQNLLCFGMITGIRCKYPQVNETQTYHPQPAQFTSPKSFILSSYPTTSGSLEVYAHSMIQGLLEEAALQLQVSCTFGSQSSSIAKSTSTASDWTPCRLTIIIYGPLDLFDDIGVFLQQHDSYLQRPQGCDRNVPYRNPHTLAAMDLAPYPMTFELQDVECRSQLQQMPSQSDLLDSLVSNEELEEAQQPLRIRTLLNKHQSQALTFLKRREKGWNTDGSAPDVWQVVQVGNKNIFKNTINNTHQLEEPKDFRGGILADPMGLGKTLTMISLIASDLDDICNSYLPAVVQLTLVIVPPSLISTWEEQLMEHLAAGALSHQLHHAKSRFSNETDFSRPGIVLTTYHTVASEFKHNEQLLFTIPWRRIILDEAHCIRNPESRMTKAICKLRATSRWAVTGTPLQNRLTDIASLLTFLHADPYEKPSAFEADFIALWKRGHAEEALERLKKLTRCLLLRRAKSTIEIPSRTDLVCPLEFRHDERAIYEDVHRLAKKDIEEALLQASKSSKTYLNALKHIDALRRICNVGVHYKAADDLGKSSPSSEWAAMAQQSFNYILEFRDAVCYFCATNIGIAEGQSSTEATMSQMQIFSCSRIMCSACLRRAMTRGEEKICGHEPLCQVARVQTDDGGETISEQLETSFNIHQPLPTKEQALLLQLKELEGDVKSLVFSFWTTTLDLIEIGLNNSQTSFVRFDGKTSQKNRKSAIDRFRNDPSIRVMLLTLSCGAAGLNLTAASRVYLMEPHWNPTVEEQALARVHRIGQTKEVTTVRFFIRNSFEEHVLEVQKSKKELADMVLSETCPSTSRNGLEQLRSLL